MHRSLGSVPTLVIALLGLTSLVAAASSALGPAESLRATKKLGGFVFIRLASGDRHSLCTNVLRPAFPTSLREFQLGGFDLTRCALQ